jgi:hypothetical protein
MTRRKFFSVASMAAAAHRFAIGLSRHRHTRLVRRRTPECGFSIKFVLARQRCSDGGMFIRLIVKHSSIPSRQAVGRVRMFPLQPLRHFFQLRNSFFRFESPGGSHQRFGLRLLVLGQPFGHVPQLVLAASGLRQRLDIHRECNMVPEVLSVHD